MHRYKMLRNFKYCTNAIGFLQHSGGIPHRNLRGQLRYINRLLSNGSDDGKDRIFRWCRPYQSVRLYSNGSKDDKSSGDKSIKQSGEECKPVTPMPPSKGDSKPIEAYKHPCPEASRRVSLKIMPAGQECGKPHMMQDCPQPECAYDDDRKPDYTKLIIGGILLLLATLLALYYAGFFGGEDEEDEGDGARKKIERTSRRPRVITKTPAESKDIPNNVPYLLIGGGTASFAAFRAIKSAEPSAKVLVIDSDEYFPYMRPPLSKEIWFNQDPASTKKLQFKQWNGSERSLYYEPPDFYTDVTKLKQTMTGGVSVARGWTVKKIDPFQKKVYLEDDYEIEYEKCLLATGSKPKNLALFEDATIDIKDRVTLYRGIFDFEELEEIIRETEPRSIAIVGGGFLGSEIACSLARRARGTGMKVHQIFREGGNMGKVLPEYLSSWTTKKVQAEGVNVIPNTVVDDAVMSKDNVNLILSNGKKISADQVIVAIGVTPNTELAELSCLELDPDHGGFLVNAELMARSSLWSAGDCTCFYDVKLGRRRVEHHDHAVVSGRLAGENMTGAGKPYYHQSMFWSDLGPDVGYEAIGIVDSSLPTVGVFARATDRDTPKAVVEATDEANRAKTEDEANKVAAAAAAGGPPGQEPPFKLSGEDAKAVEEQLKAAQQQLKSVTEKLNLEDQLKVVQEQMKAAHLEDQLKVVQEQMKSANLEEQLKVFQDKLNSADLQDQLKAVQQQLQTGNLADQLKTVTEQLKFGNLGDQLKAAQEQLKAVTENMNLEDQLKVAQEQMKSANLGDQLKTVQEKMQSANLEDQLKAVKDQLNSANVEDQLKAVQDQLKSATGQVEIKASLMKADDPKNPPPKANEDYGKGVIFYLRDDIVVGIVMWNVFNRMSIARQVLKEEKRYADLNEVAKLFNIHEE